jgi:hypothetical protein
MLNNNIFYHSITRKIIVAFGSLFSDIKIDRKNNEGISEQVLAVPIAYAPKEKWLVRIDQDPTLDKHVYTILPRMSFEITGMNYDSARKTNRTSYITCGDIESGVSKVYAPVPYNIDINLYILTKTQEDALQIVEQILPYFTPEYTLSIKAIPESNIITDIPIIINSVSVQDDYDGDFQTRRFVTYTLSFTLKSNMFGPVYSGGLINRTLIDMTDSKSEILLASFDATGDITTGQIDTESWTELD